MSKQTIHAAIREVLKRAGRPMSSSEIYGRIIADGLYSFRAAQPKQVVLAQLRRRCTNISFASASKAKFFERTQDGMYRLAATNTAPEISDQRIEGRLAAIRRLHDEHLADVRKDIVRQIRGLTPTQFERFARHLIVAYGFRDVAVTKPSRDGGIDGFGRLPVGLAHLSVAFQCKNWRSTVGRPEVDRFRGAIQGRFEQGVFMTPSAFSTEAQRASFIPGAVPIVLLDGNEIARIVLEKQLGTELVHLTLYSFSVDVLIDDPPLAAATAVAATSGRLIQRAEKSSQS